MKTNVGVSSSEPAVVAMHKIGHGGTHLTSWAQELRNVALAPWLGVMSGSGLARPKLMTPQVAGR